MARDIVLNFQIRLPRWSTRRWLVITLIALGIGAGAVYAKVNWTPFVGGTKLTSQQLNDNFKAMGDAIETLQAQPPVLLPHLYDETNKVDMGIYLGSYTIQQGAPLFLVWNSTVKAPLLVPDANWSSTIVSGMQFDGNNCTGNAYLTSLPVNVFANITFDTSAGTIYQVTGQVPRPMMVGVLTVMDDKGKCQLNPQTIGAPWIIKDTKVPNLMPINIYWGGLQGSLKLL